MSTGNQQFDNDTAPCFRFCHAGGAVTLQMQQLEAPIPTEGEDALQLMMWKYCTSCDLITNFVPVADSTWSLSFAMCALMAVGFCYSSCLYIKLGNLQQVKVSINIIRILYRRQKSSPFLFHR